MGTELVLGFAVAGTFVLYALFGGADFGGGVWDLLASGPRKREQRELIAQALGPVWEVNHIWLIAGVVLLFSAFPRAFAALMVALHVPLTLFLLGIVLRGAAFTFRTYDSRGDAVQRRWGLLFSGASVLSPALLGMCVGAMVSGAIRVEGRVVVSGFFASWTTPFALAVGVLALCLFAYLAAVYLTYEAEEGPLREDFRRRALGAAGAVFLAAFGVLGLAREGAPRVWQGLVDSPWALGFHAATAVMALAAFGLLWARRLKLARAAAALQVALIVLGWAVSQYPYLVVPDITLRAAAVSPHVQRVLLGALVVAALTVVPSVVLLMRTFQRRPPAEHQPTEGTGAEGPPQPSDASQSQAG